MADEETKAPKPRAPRAPRAKKVEAEPELKAVVAEVEEPKEVKKPAARKSVPAAKKPVRKTTAKKGESPLDVLVYDSKGEQSGELKLPAAIFGQAPNVGVMHQALQRQLNNARQGNASTKTRGDVSGGGRKPFRQKGLGRSRHGSEREPSMVGGGSVFGPHPRSFRQEMPRKMRRLALRSALAVKANEGKVSVIEGFAELEAPKTRAIVELLEAVGVEGTALVVLAASNEVISRSAANLTWAKTILAHNLNLYDLFTHDHVVIAKDALELIEETFA
ncbi:MAG: 50S ribosomal protein L4 [Chloroflexi bacterium]|nr:MAG: 50S ribosomal protein L4 [Chloroflexota bacterium]